MENKNGIYLFAGQVFQDGFLHLDLPISHLTSSSINPTLEERLAFGQYSHLWKTTETIIPQFQVGDDIEMISGPLRGVGGKVVEIQDHLVKFSFAKGIYEAAVIDAQRVFKLGDLVEVCLGDFKGAIGYIVGLDGSMA